MYRRIPLRNFQQNATDYLGELPIVLTSHNHPVAIVISPEEEKPGLFETHKEPTPYVKYYKKRDFIEKYKSISTANSICEHCHKENVTVTEISWKYTQMTPINNKKLCQICMAKLFAELKHYPKSVIC